MTFDWISFVLGYLFATIVGFIIECMCIAAGRSDIEKWMESDEEREKQKNN